MHYHVEMKGNNVFRAAHGGLPSDCLQKILRNLLHLLTVRESRARPSSYFKKRGLSLASTILQGFMVAESKVKYMLPQQQLYLRSLPRHSRHRKETIPSFPQSVQTIHNAPDAALRHCELRLHRGEIPSDRKDLM